jgi:hypothetical protein
MRADTQVRPNGEGREKKRKQNMEEQKKFLSKADALAADDIPVRDVEVPEWGGWVRIRGLDGKAASQFSRQLVKIGKDGKPQATGLDNFMAKLLAVTIVDQESGKPIFNEDDLAALGAKSAKVLKRLSDIAADLSGMSDKAVEEAEKNSETPDADSPTD